MSETAARLMTELTKLSAEERADIAYHLLCSLDDGEDADAEAAWDSELERRAQAIINGTAKGRPAEEVFDELRKQYP